MKYKICVPIPIKSINVSENALLIKKVLDTSPNLVELRFDYLSKVQFLTKDFTRSLLNEIQYKVPVILTFRNSVEGGQIEILEDERFQIYKMFLEAKPKFVDIEINTEKEILNKIMESALRNKVTLIFSFHDFEKTPTYTKASNLLDNFYKELINMMAIDSKLVENCIFKLVFTAHSFEDNLIPLKLCKIHASKKFKLISFCMGDMGLFSRIFCVYSGSFFTYASFEEKTAPGQKNISEIREILKLMNFRI
ncbi:MAG TPA: type I 3-dehydroquinate dehydratase [archaeon]|nr:type I 3-dehydroquinate dehydratase [archaeon]